VKNGFHRRRLEARDRCQVGAQITIEQRVAVGQRGIVDRLQHHAVEIEETPR
jgi:hypothetical protein